ncbi:uridine kinase family protein [Streptomyces sp. CA-250714]|uniref:uridine kinase family protein n=1 Tax=Streptomyces sp. CA-250714 TaxID=3240060 RepID=UPI003D9013A7
MPAPRSLEALADRLAALPASCGPVRLVGVDGHAGSGKTTLARQLSELLGGAPVLHLDDLACHEALFDWTERLAEQVLGPLERGAPARYVVYDWVARAHSTEAVLPPAPVILVEGVGAGRAALRPYLACLLWADMAAEAAWQRGRRRDGPGQHGFWERWIPAERAHFAADPSRPFADFLVRETGKGRPGYEIRERAEEAPDAALNMTLRITPGS